MFFDKMKGTLTDLNRSKTENGALGYLSTGKALLDLNFAISSLRSASEEDIILTFVKAFYDDRITAVKWLFYVRDVRSGLGERRLFRVLFNYLAVKHTNIIKPLIPLIAEYGRFDDLLVLFQTPVFDIVVKYIDETLQNDIKLMAQGEPISLLAKWLPSINTSSKSQCAKARKLAKSMDMTQKSYRQTLSKLRKYLDIVEIKMSARRWNEIKYPTVPSKANLIYRKAFYRNDEVRREKYLESLEKGETKINAAALFPHDIVNGYCENTYNHLSYDVTLEQLWKSLPNTVKPGDNTIVVADGSGSMTIRIGNTNLTALSVANALAIYFAERSDGQFKNKYITFSSKPQLVDLSNGKNLMEKLEIALTHSEVSNTNIEKVFELILRTAIKNNMKQNELPKNILIISDMEFDNATSGNPNDILFNTIAKSYTQNNYKLPRLIFWNVNSRTNTIPISQNKLGVALVSGFSVNTVNMVMSQELDPYKALLQQLNTERYKPVEDALVGEV